MAEQFEKNSGDYEAPDIEIPESDLDNLDSAGELFSLAISSNVLANVVPDSNCNVSTLVNHNAAMGVGPTTSANVNVVANVNTAANVNVM